VRLSTAQKLAFARLLGRGVRFARALTGDTSGEVECTRRGVRWSLDLNEGVQLAIYLGLYERSTARALSALVTSGATVIDIGANIGAHALPLAARVGARGRVIAIEPADAVVDRLRRNLALNQALASRLTVVHSALGAAGERAQTRYYARWPLDHADSAHPVHQGVGVVSTANVTTLDEEVDRLGSTRIDLIKLDVDGHELPILAGASRTLARDRPTIVFEWAPYLLREQGQAETALPDLLIAHGYDLLSEARLKPLSRSPAEIAEGIPEGGSINLVARAGHRAPP
jgi:FkbM family methyltransferase